MTLLLYKNLISKLNYFIFKIHIIYLSLSKNNQLFKVKILNYSLSNIGRHLLIKEINV